MKTNDMKTHIKLTAKIPEELSGKRLDAVLSVLFPEYSRSRLQTWIKAGYVKLDAKQVTNQRIKVRTGQEVLIKALLEPEETWRAQQIALNIVYEDSDLIVINKPPGMVVHPGAGNKEGTLLNALLHHAPELANLPRAGIVHRLDKDTSGLMVVARTLAAYTKLIHDLQKRRIKREYQAIVCGVMTAGGVIEAPIGRHRKKRIHMAVTETGKKAVTHYRIIKRFRAHTHVKVILETGRTHQIRVHFAHIHYPIVGDQTYGGRLRIPKAVSAELREYLQKFKRQALHAVRLELRHPTSDKVVSWKAPLPDDMQRLLKLLKESDKA